jgi:2-methylcitrate dehydratase PrpD
LLKYVRTSIVSIIAQRQRTWNNFPGFSPSFIPFEKNMSEQRESSKALPAASLTEALVQGLRRPIDTATRERAAWHWLDWMACVAVGRRAPVAQALAAWRLPGHGGGPGAWPCLAGLASSDMQAVCLEAGLANVEEMDDMHREAILHPGPAVLPVVAHLARHTPLDLGRALDAVVHGYETMVRVGRSLGPGHYGRWHNTATAGVFGAAAAAAHALGLGPEATVWALGNAGTQAAGLWQVRLEPVMSKQLHTGHAAWAGLCAATLAQAGFTGPRFILEGEKGFYAALCPDPHIERLLAAESDWLIHGTSFKPWPACRHTHAAIDAALALRERLGTQVLEASEIEIAGFGDALRICDRPAPLTRTEAKFSLQFAVAAALWHGPLLPAHFDEAALGDPRVLALAARCRLRLDPVLDQAYPDRYGAEVRLGWPDGRVHAVRFEDSLGDPPRPMDVPQRLHKIASLMDHGGVLPARRDELLDTARQLPSWLPGWLAEPVPGAWLAPLA